MTKKQRKNLIRIIAAAVLVAGLLLLFHFTELPEWTEIVLYLIPYFAVGYDVLIKAEFPYGGCHRGSLLSG